MPQILFGRAEAGGSPVTLPNLYTDSLNKVGNVSLSGQTAAIAATSMYSVHTAGLYKVSYYLRITAAGSSGNIQPSFIHDDSQVTDTVSFGDGADVAGDYVSGEFIVYAAAGTTIRYQTAFNSVVGSPAYFLRVAVERL